MTDPQTAEQSKTQWVFVDTDLIVGFRDIHDKVLVRIPTDLRLDDFGEACEAAMRDPSRVLNVSAYPEVVEALKLLLAWHDEVQRQTIIPSPFGIEDAQASLAAVHPAAEGDKE